MTKVQEYLASYTLHLTATNLLFLANCEVSYTKKRLSVKNDKAG
ncbi:MULTISPECIES: DUF7014 domain-containing protein [Serratia]